MTDRQRRIREWKWTEYEKEICVGEKEGWMRGRYELELQYFYSLTDIAFFSLSIFEKQIAHISQRVIAHKDLECLSTS